MRKGKLSRDWKGLHRATFVVFEGDDEGDFAQVADYLQVDHAVCPFVSLDGQIAASPPDILLFGPQRGERRKEAFDSCRRLRRSGYQKIIILLIGGGEDFTSTADITAAGFDHYLLLEGSVESWEESVSWAIINRRRKSKN